MKDLLYLKDDQIKEFIQLLYYAYRETFSDPREILSKKFFGPAHLRALHLIEGNPGINLGELIFKLKVTKQSLNRVLRDLIKSKSCSIWIQCNVNIISRRILNQGKRPLLANKNIIDTLIKKNKKRIKFYRQADIHILNENPNLEITVDAIIENLFLNKVINTP